MDANNLKLKLGEARSEFSANVQADLRNLNFAVPEAAERSADIITKETLAVLKKYADEICNYLSKL